VYAAAMRRSLVARVVAAAAVAAVGCGRGEVPRELPLPQPDGVAPRRDPSAAPLSDRIASYRIAARLDVARHRIAATETLVWRNTGQTPVDTLPFHLYLNAFKNEASLFMRTSGGRHRDASAAPDGWGWIHVRTLRVDGGPDVSETTRFVGPDDTVLELPLATAVPAGGQVTVELEFEAQLPQVFARTGYRDEFHLVAQWFPKIGVRAGPPGQERWRCDPFHAASEFFADFGVYDVAVTVPRTHAVAATGVLTAAEDHADGTRTLTYRAEDVHDFAWMADPYMQLLRGTATTGGGPVEVRVWHRPAQRAFAARHLHAAIGTVEQYGEILFPYPYSILSVIDPPPEAAAGAGGMEYPTFVTTAGDSFATPPGIRLPEFVTVHEVGHNWLQGMLASDEVREAWLDEGVNEYLNGVVMERLYGPASAIDWRGWRAGAFAMERALSRPRALPAPIATASHEFPDLTAYGGATYQKTALALRTLEQIVGTERFLAALGAFARAHKFRHPTGEELFASLERELGEDLDWFIEPAFRRLGAVELRLRQMTCRPAHEPRGVFGSGDDAATWRTVAADATSSSGYACEVVVVDLGAVPVPVDVEVELDDGSTERLRWDRAAAADPADGGPTWRRWRLERPRKIREVRIDPDGRLPLDDAHVDGAVRARPDRGAAARVGAHAQWWTQTLLQVTGL
jgi:hypothetical protein